MPSIATYLVVFLIIVPYSKLVCSFEAFEGTVSISPELGITITSASISLGNKIPLWTEYAFNHRGNLSEKLNAQTRGNKFTPSCSVELLGFDVSTEKGSRLNMQEYRVHKSSSPIAAGSGTAKLSHMEWSTDKSVKISGAEHFCQYKQIFDYMWTSQSFKKRLLKHNAYIYYCPIRYKASCDKMTSSFQLNQENGTLKFTLKSIMYSQADNSERIFTNSFIMTSAATGVLVTKSNIIKNREPVMGVCAARPYVSTDRLAQTAFDNMLTHWVDHYTKLRTRIMLFDGSGNNSHLSNHMRNRGHYFGYSIFTLLDRRVKKPNVLSKNDWNDGYSDGKSHQAPFKSLLENDDDKIATLTHCRFEQYAMYGLVNVLVADTDEFYFNKLRKPNYPDQSSSLVEMVSEATEHNFMQVRTEVAIPYFYNISSSDTVMECMLRSLQKTGSIIGCFSSRTFSPSWTKSMHFKMTCPITSFHEACNSQAFMHGSCMCESIGQTECCRSKLQCCGAQLIHLSSFTKGHYAALISEQNAIKKSIKIANTHPNILVHLLNSSNIMTS